MSNATRKKRRNRRKTATELSTRKARRTNAALANSTGVSHEDPDGSPQTDETQMPFEIAEEQVAGAVMAEEVHEEATPESPTAMETAGLDAMYEEARSATERRELKRAFSIYYQILEADPGHCRARNNLALLLESEGKTQDAIAHLDICVEQNPDNTDVLINRGAVLGQCGKYREAHRDLATVVEREPQNSEALFNLGILLSRKGLWTDAAAHLRRSIELDSSRASAYFYLGEALNHVDDLEGALQAYQHAVELNANHQGSLYGIGIVYDRMNRPAEAAQMYRRSREIAGV